MNIGNRSYEPLNIDALEAKFNATFEDWRDQWVALNGEVPGPREAARAMFDALSGRVRELEKVLRAALYVIELTSPKSVFG
jgi:hypothetical protein